MNALTWWLFRPGLERVDVVLEGDTIVRGRVVVCPAAGTPKEQELGAFEVLFEAGELVGIMVDGFLRTATDLREMAHACAREVDRLQALAWFIDPNHGGRA